MPDRRLSAPYGNIAFFNTPNADRVAYSLYNEEKQRGVRLQNENAQLDNLLNKEFSKVRSADTEEIINKYNDYKNTKKQVLFDKKIQNDPRLYNAYNQAAGEKLADLYASINKSTEAKDAIQMAHQERKANPNKFSRDFYGTMNEYSKTPTSKLAPDWQDKLLYSGPITNFEPYLNKAAGTPRVLGEPTITKEGLQNKIATTKGFNSAFEFYDRLTSSIGGSEVHEDFIKHFGNITPEQEQYIDGEYQKLIQNPNYRKLYGIPEGYDFPDEAYTTETGRAARLLAEKHAIERQPSTDVKLNTDPLASSMQQLANQREMEGLRQRNRERNLGLAQSYRLAAQDYKHAQTQQQATDVLNGLVDDQFNDGANDKVDFTLFGKKYSGRTVKIPRSLQEKYARKDPDDHTVKEYPDEYYMTDDKKYVVPIYWQRDKGGDIIAPGDGSKKPILARKGEPILMSTYKADLGKEFLTKKQLGEELSDEFDDTPPPTEIQAPIVPPKEKAASKKQTIKKNDPLGLF